MMIEFYIYAFVIGLATGSFFNVVAMRPLKGESIVLPPSHCTTCDYQLKWYDNIPVLSYLILRGKCRNCKEKISWIYPTFEFITGIIFVWVFHEFRMSIEGLFVLILLSMLLVVTITDILERIIPNKILIWFGIPLFVFSTMQPGFDFGPLFARIVSFLVLLIFFISVLLVTKGKGIGGGDVKLLLLLALIFNPGDIFIIIFLSAAIGLIYGLYFLAKKQKEIPFAPAIFMSVLIFVFLNEKIYNFFINSGLLL